MEANIVRLGLLNGEVMTEKKEMSISGDSLSDIKSKIIKKYKLNSSVKFKKLGTELLVSIKSNDAELKSVLSIILK